MNGLNSDTKTFKSQEDITTFLAKEIVLRDGGMPIVHCSAGCGRTGTLIAIDAVLARSSGEGDEVLGVVRELREQRVNMVQSLEQFAFCYEAVLDRVINSE